MADKSNQPNKEQPDISKVESETTLEESFMQIEDLLSSMEAKDISLEEAFALYEQGIHKLKYCNDKIDTVEKKMLLLNPNGELEEF